jgi:glycosyltransferase involved in cell wall biosynthesis
LKIIVSQIGAREHYAVAQALHEQGLLAGLVTDWYAFQFLPGWLQRFGGQAARAARCEAIPDGLVRAFPIRSLLWRWRVRRLAAKGRLYEAFTQTDSAFATTIAQCQLPPHDVFFGYSYASLEMLAAEKQRGVLTVLDQIDPGAVECRLVAEEMSRFPEMAGPRPEFPSAYYERNRREWELADIIIANSEWSREAIIAEGADAAKIEMLPLAYVAEDGRKRSEVRSQNLQPSAFSLQPSTAPLRVLWLGQVNLRKGIHYLLAAARLLESENIHFDVVGPVGILAGAVTAAPRNLTFHGPVSRDRAAEWYRRSDVFVLPTLSDGFALTQLEALAHGVPVITTANCGRVIEPGSTGFIIPPRDPQALADAVLKFATDRKLSASMARACRAAVRAFSVAEYGKRLVGIIQGHSAKR